MNWKYKVKIMHLMDDKEDIASVRKNMMEIADALKTYNCFDGFDKSKFYNIPDCDDVVRPIDYANKLIDRMYDYADTHKIWIE